VTEAGLDVRDFGPRVLHDAGKGVAQSVDLARAEMPQADVGDTLDA